MCNENQKFRYPSIPSVIWSDKGTNYEEAERERALELFLVMNSTSIRRTVKRRFQKKSTLAVVLEKEFLGNAIECSMQQ